MDPMTSAQFMDKLKQFQTERAADTVKCARLFAEYDEDGSGRLEREEIFKLAQGMGLEALMSGE